jgi:hypothetical protein
MPSQDRSLVHALIEVAKHALAGYRVSTPLAKRRLGDL